ncbi:MAG: alpha/beta hydrolase [Flavobacteriaceae bacterium]
MNLNQKRASYTTDHPYTTLNRLTAHTQNIWMVFHGMGYLSRYFLRYFETLPPAENYFIAPQAPSKYYLNDTFRHVGASWLTKEDTQIEISNILSYIDTVYRMENIPKEKNLIVMGYSQGVSIAMRWVASRKIPCHHLVLHSGGIPKELDPEDVSFLLEQGTRISVWVGNKDAYITKERLESEQERVQHLFKGAAKLTIFEGEHKVNIDLIKSLV